MSQADDFDALLAQKIGAQPVPDAVTGKSAADEFDARLAAASTPKYSYSEGPATAEQQKYARVEVAGTSASPAYMADINQARGSMAGVGDNLRNLVYGATKGAADMVQGPAQMILNGAATLSGDGPAGQYVKDRAAQFNKYLGNQEAQYQADTPGSGAAGIGRVGAGVLPFLFSGGSSAAPQIAKELPMTQRIAEALIKGGAYGADQTVNDAEGTGDFFKKKGTQIAIGAGSAAAAVPVGSAIARVISPNTAPEVKALIKEGVTPTPGQILGGGWAKTEDKMTSVPILGDMIKNSQRRAVEDFNRAAYNRALEPIGEKSTANIGRAGVAEVKDKLGAAYDGLLPKLQFKADQQFSSEINNLTSMVQNGNVSPEVAKQFNNIVKNEVFSRMTRQGAMDGKSFKELETSLGLQIKRFGASQNPNDQAVGSALSEVLSSARGSLARANPQYAPELKTINEGYANYARIRQAASGVGAAEGVFTPAQLQSAVKASDKSVGKGNFATGKALMQDLSEPGKSVLGSHYPDSGTPGRAMMLGAPGLAAAAYMNPLLAAAVGGGGTLAAAPYTQIGQKLAAALLAKRPAGAETIANLLRNVSPIAGAAVTPLLAPSIKN